MIFKLGLILGFLRLFWGWGVRDLGFDRFFWKFILGIVLVLRVFNIFYV